MAEICKLLDEFQMNETTLETNQSVGYFQVKGTDENEFSMN